MKLEIGTRGSNLALTQSRWVADALARAGFESELVVISTSGDRSSAPTFGAIGPQGVFVREIEQALLERKVDLAVHSYKDLPTTSPDGLVVAAVPPRRDPADWLLWGKRGGKRGQTPFSVLPTGARVGTASARRGAWLRHYRPDLDVVSLRGNVPTRLKRLADGDFDAIVLAGAGIERLEEASDLLDGPLSGVERERLDPERFVPAPAQGALALQCHEGNDTVRAALAALDDAATRTAIGLERRALELAEGGCDAAFGAWAHANGSGFRLVVMAENDGRIERAEASGHVDSDLASDAMRDIMRISGSAA